MIISYMLLIYLKGCLYLGVPAFLLFYGLPILRYVFTDTRMGRAVCNWWWKRSDDLLGLFLALGSLLVLIVITWIRNAK